MTQNNSREFQGREKRFVQVGAMLGGGRTAQVFPVQELTAQGAAPAIYALKLLTGQEHHAEFFKEVETLQLLARYGEMQVTNPDGSPMVPEIIDYQDQGADQFIVMTLARGRTLDEILRAEGRLHQAEALAILANLTRLFHILHSRIKRSYLDFQPGNVFWERENGTMLVLDWGTLSPEGQTPDVAGDILFLGRWFYRMLVGIYPPARSLAADANWDKLTLGVQDILRKATHANPQKRYGDMGAMQLACEAQLALWTQETGALLTALGEYKTNLVSLAPDSPNYTGDVRRAYNLGLVLDARRQELGERTASVLDDFMREVVHLYGQYGEQVAKGMRLLENNNSPAAKELFIQAKDEAGDDVQKLTAYRWILVAGTLHQGNRIQATAACRALVAGSVQEAAGLLAQLTPPVEEGLLSLQADAQAQSAWAVAQPALRAAQEKGDPASVQAALPALRTLKEAVDKLPPDYRALLDYEWGELDQWIASLTEQAEKLAGREERIQVLGATVRGKRAAEAMDSLHTAFDETPRHVGLVALAVEVIRNELIREPKDLSAGDMAAGLASVRALISLALSQGRGGGQEAELRTLWRDTETMLKLDQALSGSGSAVTALKDCLSTLNRGDEIAAPALQKRAVAHVLAEARRRQDVVLAENVVSAAEDAGLKGLASSLNDEVNSIRVEVSTRMQLEATQRMTLLTDLGERVRGLLAGQRAEHVELAREQLAVGDRLLAGDAQWAAVRDTLARDIQAEAERLERVGERETHRELLTAKLTALRERLDRAQTQAEAAQVVTDLGQLNRDAKEMGITELLPAIEAVGEAARNREKYIETIQAPMAEAQAAFDAYAAFDSTDPDLRSARFAKLRRARTKLDEAKKPGIPVAGLEELGRQIDARWAAEGFQYDPENLENPLLKGFADLKQSLQSGKSGTKPSGAEGTTADTAGNPEAPEKKTESPWLIPLLSSLLGAAIVIGGIWILLELYSFASSGEPEVPAPISASSAVVPADAPTATLTTTPTPLPPEAAMLVAEQTLAPRLTEIAQVNAASLASLQSELNTAISGGDEAMKQAVETAMAQAQEANTVREQQAITATTQAAQATALAITATVQATQEAILTAAVATQAERETTLNVQATQQAVAQATLTPQAASIRAISTAVAQREATVAAREFALEEAASRSDLAAPGQFVITFPPEGAEFYVAPWQIRVEANVWLFTVANYRLTLTKAGLNQTAAVLKEFQLTSENRSDTYERGFENNTALFDSFPGLDDAGKAALRLDANGQLPPGEYVLGLEAQVDGKTGWQPLPIAHKFTILDSTSYLVANIANTGNFPLRRRWEPRDESATPEQTIPLEAEVSILGMASVNNVDWYLVETTDQIPRRSWVETRYLDGLAETEREGIADLMLPRN